ncbi:MAG: acetyl-CoA carboxylase carboxyltransferase subunit beta [Alphaproteobacteria bacterium]|nr:acetyl-CoA carboxylase carboxyltransferase subunit beta [Alphaproteobacteria bacterium]
MNWLTNYVRPKISKLVEQKDIPDNLWIGCSSCGKMIFRKELEENSFVCPSCGHHFKLATNERLKMMFDEGQYNLVDLPQVPLDPLNFTDVKKYTDRVKDARKKTGQEDAIVVAEGLIGSCPVVVGVFDFDFMGGSMGTAVGEAIIKAANLAIKKEAALILIPSSGGARMQEGMLSLMQMPRTTLAIKLLKEKRLPYITIFTNPTTGGVTASFAMLGDIHLAEPGALIGFAGARVIEQTIRETLPEGFQRSEYLQEHGMIDAVVDRRQMREELVKILNLLMHTTV